jgi:hypothetical protein
LSLLEDVTVFIPFLNGTNEEWLARAISSLPQGTKYIVARNDGELTRSLNEALAAADTTWVLRLDATDVAVDGMLENLYAYSFDADVVYPALLGADPDLEQIEWEHPAWSFCRNRLEFQPYLSGTSLMRRRLVLDVGGYSDQEAMEDWELYVRLSRAGARFKACNDAKLLCRVLPTSRTRMRINGDGFEDFKRFRVQWEPRADNVATFYYQGSYASAYLRAVLPCRYLPGIATNDLRYRLGEDITPTGEGNIVMQWPGDHDRAGFLVAAHEKGRKVFVEVDDNYHTAPVKGFLDKAGFKARIAEKSYNTVQGHRWICRHADGILVTTPWLADVYSELNDNVIVAPNCVDPDDWSVLPEIPESQVTKVAWFASVSHLPDMRLVWGAMDEVSRRDDTLVWASDLAGMPRGVQRQQWTNDLSQYWLMMMWPDIGLAPVVDSDSGNGRSDIKATEYAMGKALPIVSDVAPYRDWEHGVTCLKARDAKEFSRHLRWAIEHPQERREIAENAHRWALANRDIKSNAHVWRKALS